MMRKIIAIEKIIVFWMIIYHASLFGQAAKMPLVCEAQDKVRTLKFDIDSENRLIGKKIGHAPLMLEPSQAEEKPTSIMHSIIRINQMLPLNFDCIVESDDDDVRGIRENYFEGAGEKYLAIWKVDGSEIPCTYDIITYDGLLRTDNGISIYGVHTGNGKGISEVYECKHQEYGSKI